MDRIATVIGLGESGVSASVLLQRMGWTVRVTECEDSPFLREKARHLKMIGVEVELGGHRLDFIKGSQLVIASPGVPEDSSAIIWAHRLNIPVVDEIELGFRYCPSKIVAITGTNGKSTTVTLIGDILRRAGKKVVVCGNIGEAFCGKVIELDPESIVVLEVSSFQLQRIRDFRPYISVILNITQNHLDRHRDFADYIKTKLRIVSNQQNTDWAILNADDHFLKRLNYFKSRRLYFGIRSRAVDAYLEKGVLKLNLNKRNSYIIEIEKIPLSGRHNIQNCLAAMLVSHVLEIDSTTIAEAIASFRPLEHRYEFVDEINGVRIINDSKSTTVDATYSAISATKGQVVLIAGGRDKGSDFTALRGIIRRKVRCMVLIGESAQKIKTQLLGTTVIIPKKDLEEAVRMSLKIAKRGDTVLFSPMCSSFDMFNNFEHRGASFKEIVRSFKESQGKGAYT